MPDFRRALAVYEEVLAAEPGYAPAWAGISFAEWWIGSFGEAADVGLRVRAKEAADRAILLAPDVADGYLARGLVRRDFEFDWAGSRSDLERARGLRPSNADNLLNLAYLVGILGNLPEALDFARRATEVDPLDPEAWVVLGALHHFSGDAERARLALSRALEISPQHTDAQITLCNVLVAAGRAEEALAVAALAPLEWLRSFCAALAEHDLGHSAESQAALGSLIARSGTVAAYQIAQNFAWRDDPDRAFLWLERAYVQRDSGLGAVRVDPLFHKLHGDARWDPFLRKMKL
jgi:tetratricopeptide (TPR) repeat protein